jgi:hypothetical protein
MLVGVYASSAALQQLCNPYALQGSAIEDVGCVLLCTVLLTLPASYVSPSLPQFLESLPDDGEIMREMEYSGKDTT